MFEAQRRDLPNRICRKYLFHMVILTEKQSFCFREQVLNFHQGKKFVCSIMLIMFSKAEIRDLRLKLWTAHNPEQYYNPLENNRQSKLKQKKHGTFLLVFLMLKINPFVDKMERVEKIRLEDVICKHIDNLQYKIYDDPVQVSSYINK